MSIIPTAPCQNLAFPLRWLRPNGEFPYAHRATPNFHVFPAVDWSGRTDGRIDLVRASIFGTAWGRRHLGRLRVRQLSCVGRAGLCVWEKKRWIRNGVFLVLLYCFRLDEFCE